MEYPQGRYRHFKGGMYEVVAIAKHSETEEELVIYRNLQEPEKTWARPLGMWFETVERNGKIIPRFAPLTEDETKT